MPWRTNRSLDPRLISTFVGIGLAVGLAGCSTSADVAYGSFQAGPGYQTSRMYESRVYGDTQRGIGAENCRTVTRQATDAFGQLSSSEETVCD
ncbi:hypothetical protein [Microvirga pakistanensis]|uniref:hypothetical protein n=1 Tax=Microvirga pakistanensis TaxID=1682650 RepID=UPI00106D19D6|nr:hypothetical protein [Microvirga pakistanensis]